MTLTLCPWSPWSNWITSLLMSCSFASIFISHYLKSQNIFCRLGVHDGTMTATTHFPPPVWTKQIHTWAAGAPDWCYADDYWKGSDILFTLAPCMQRQIFPVFILSGKMMALLCMMLGSSAKKIICKVRRWILTTSRPFSILRVHKKNRGIQTFIWGQADYVSETRKRRAGRFSSFCDTAHSESFKQVNHKIN